MHPTEAKINRVLAHIIANLPKKPKLEELSQISGFSTFHLQRKFKEHTGYTLACYQEKAKLVEALKKIFFEKYTTTDAAGFVNMTAAQFCKSFKRHWSCTPSQLLTDVKAAEEIYQDIYNFSLSVPGSNLPLFYSSEQKIEEKDDGIISNCSNSSKFRVTEQIPRLIDPTMERWYGDDYDQMDSNPMMLEFLKNNNLKTKEEIFSLSYEGYKKCNLEADPILYKWVKSISESRDFILEVGCKPDGGSLYSLMKIIAEPKFIMNSSGFFVLKGLKKVCQSDANLKNVRFCLSDFCLLPFKDRSFDTVVSKDGLMEEIDRIDDHLKEVHRILKPNGRYCAMVNKIFIDHELSENLKQQINDHYHRTYGSSIPFEQLYEKYVDDKFGLNGFKIVDLVHYRSKTVDKVESEWSEILLHFGIKMKQVFYFLEAVKS